jgi:hypothetical protein
MYNLYYYCTFMQAFVNHNNIKELLQDKSTILKIARIAAG